MDYDIFWNGKIVGKAQVEKQGLYYNFLCRCRPDEKARYEIRLHHAGGEENLGLCVPEGNGLQLKTRLAVRRVGGGSYRFELMRRETAGQLFPVDPDQPFEALTHLGNGYALKRDGRLYIAIKGETPAQERQDNDPSPKSPNE